MNYMLIYINTGGVKIITEKKYLILTSLESYLLHVYILLFLEIISTSVSLQMLCFPIRAFEIYPRQHYLAETSPYSSNFDHFQP